jgi:hypothetical protein
MFIKLSESNIIKTPNTNTLNINTINANALNANILKENSESLEFSELSENEYMELKNT